HSASFHAGFNGKTVHGWFFAQELWSGALAPLAPVCRGEGLGVRGVFGRSRPGRRESPLTPNPSPPAYRGRGEKGARRVQGPALPGPTLTILSSWAAHRGRVAPTPGGAISQGPPRPWQHCRYTGPEAG